VVVIDFEPAVSPGTSALYLEISISILEDA